MYFKGDDLYYLIEVISDYNWCDVVVDVWEYDEVIGIDIYNEMFIGEIKFLEEQFDDGEFIYGDEKLCIFVMYDDNGNELMFVQDYMFNSFDVGNICWWQVWFVLFVIVILLLNVVYWWFGYFIVLVWSGEVVFVIERFWVK